MVVRLHEFARRIGGRLAVTAPDVELEALAAPHVATARDVSYQVPGFPGDVPGQAVAVLVDAATARNRTLNNPIEVGDVRMALSRATAWLAIRRHGTPAARGTMRVHSTARVSSRAQISASASIGERTEVEAGAVIGDGVAVGAFCVIGAGVCISGPAAVGNRCHIGAGCVIGTDGFAFVQEQGRWHRLPQFGGVRIGDDVVIRSQSTVHAGVFSDTVIGDGCALDSQVLIGHDARLGAGSAVAGQTAIAGAATIGRQCRIGGKVAISEGVAIADRVTVTGMSMVTRSIPEAGARYSSGWPAEHSRSWWRRVADLRRISASGRGTGA